MPCGFLLIITYCFAVIWMRFLAEVPSRRSDGDQPDWLKSSCVLRWIPSAAPRPQSDSDPQFKVTLIVFEPPVTLIPKISDLLRTPQWVNVTRDPYEIVSTIFAAWYEQMDKSAWEVTDRGVKIEKVGDSHSTSHHLTRQD